MRAQATESRPPADYREFAEVWTPFIRGVCRSCGVPAQESDDLVQNVMLYFCEHDSLAYFDPEIATFRTYLRAHVTRQCMSWRRSCAKHARLLVESPDVDVSFETGNETLGSMFYGTHDHDLEWVVSKLEVYAFLRWLAGRDRSRGRRVYRLACRVCEEARWSVEPIQRFELGKHLGISPATVDVVIVKLRELAREYGLFGR